MYKLFTSSCILLASVLAAQNQFTGNEAAKLCPESKLVVINKQSHVPSFIVFNSASQIPASRIQTHLRPVLQMQFADQWQQYRQQKDELGFTHTRFNQLYAGIPVQGGEYLIHERNGRVESANGMWFEGITLNTSPALSESAALSKALLNIGAQQYKWENPADESLLKEIRNNTSATYYPKGELVIVAANGDIFKRDFHLAWKFDVYASAPMSRNYIYVDAQTGEIVHKQNRIHEADVAGTANTMYSGTQNIICDSNAGSYRLREAGRGMGIRTLNLNNGTNTASAVDFTNGTTNWTSTANDDNAAYDAHWGAEKTYDYYQIQHGRNGIDGNGMLMISYVHYSNNYDNAYWDGTSMTYGDGSQQPGGFNPLTAIDVCGHEFTHGVTENTAGLDYQDESGALNESFSDVFGTAIEFYSKPVGNFLIGEEITVNANSALRSMSNPNQYGDPDCYTGTNWYTGTADNGGVHTNSGVQNYWFYLMCQGGSGTNDLNNAFNVTGIGISDAGRIAFRNLSVYLVNTSQYADARTYAIQSAEDLFGACTPQVTTTANAWYACGVGPVYSPTVNAAFTANITSSCSVPATVVFTNNSTNAANATWNFGDNTTSNTFNPSHVYTQAGTYNVSLSVNSTCGADSIVQSGYIVINPPNAPTGTGANSCQPATLNLSAVGPGSLAWYTQAIGGTQVATGGSYTTPFLNNTTTYYVESQVAQPPGNVGPVNSNFGTGGQHNNTSTQYLEFTVLQNCTLATADVNAGAAGNRTVTLWDNAGNQLQQVVINPPAGNSTVTLNIPLTPGSYRIGGTQMNLYRNNSGANYPYTLNGAVNITGSSAGGAFYYYLYNWGITLGACTSPRTPVIASIGNQVTAYNASAYDTVCTNTTAPFALTGGSPAGGTYSGPGVTNGIFDPAVAGQGTHTITYTYIDGNNCAGTATQTIFSSICLGVQGQGAITNIQAYPNPTSDVFTLDIQLASSQTVGISIVDLLGQTVYNQQHQLQAGSTQIPMNTERWAKGVYLIQVQTAQGMVTRRIVVR